MKLRLLIISILLLIAPALYADSEVTIGGKTGAAHIIQDEGTSLRPRPYLNFTGAGATCTDDGGKTVCNITGSDGVGSGTVYYKESGSAAVSFDTVDFRSGFDTSFSGTEVDVSLDLSEVLTGQATADTVNRIYINSIDISDDTNLTAGTGITLTGDTVSVTDNYVLNTSDTMSGSLDIDGTLTLGSGGISIANATGNLDGEVIQNDTIDDDSIDLVDITLADFTNDANFLTTVDISNNTNLTAGTGITLTGDTVSVTDNYVLNTSDTMSVA